MTDLELGIFALWLVQAAVTGWRFYGSQHNRLLWTMTEFEAVAVIAVDVASAAAVGAIWPILAVVASLELAAGLAGR